MEYKGYMASISYDEASDLLHGSVVNSGIYPVVTFMAPDVAGLKREFKISVDEYLAACEAEGAEPIKPFSGDISIDLGVLLHLRGSSRLALQRQHGLRQPLPDEFAVFRVDFYPDCPPPQIRRRP